MVGQPESHIKLNRNNCCAGCFGGGLIFGMIAGVAGYGNERDIKEFIKARASQETIQLLNTIETNPYSSIEIGRLFLEGHGVEDVNTILEERLPDVPIENRDAMILSGRTISTPNKDGEVWSVDRSLVTEEVVASVGEIPLDYTPEGEYPLLMVYDIERLGLKAAFSDGTDNCSVVESVIPEGERNIHKQIYADMVFDLFTVNHESLPDESYPGYMRINYSNGPEFIKARTEDPGRLWIDIHSDNSVEISYSGVLPDDMEDIACSFTMPWTWDVESGVHGQEGRLLNSTVAHRIGLKVYEMYAGLSESRAPMMGITDNGLLIIIPPYAISDSVLDYAIRYKLAEYGVKTVSFPDTDWTSNYFGVFPYQNRVESMPMTLEIPHYEGEYGGLRAKGAVSFALFK